MKALVIGAAASGTAATMLLRADGADVSVYDRDPVRVGALREHGLTMHSGEWRDRLLRDVDLVVVSPGVPESAAPISGALRAGTPVISELELAWRRLETEAVAVTGTNGKTTVTRLIVEMATASGLQVAAAGNIGTPLSSIVGDDLDLVVIEASSFQLRFIDTFRPRVAVLLNVAPDHLDWHGSYEAYAAAKSRIFANHDGSDILVYDADDTGAAGMAASAPSRRLGISGRRRLPAGGMEGGKIWVGGEAFIAPPDLDAAFGLDYAAAAVAAMEVGATRAGIEDALHRFTVGPHRRTVVGVWERVQFVDDSKATNPHAALASIARYDSVILIAGGLAKGLDVTPLVSAPGVKRVVAIGESAPLLAAVGGDRVVIAEDMDGAVALAELAAAPGDTVLLAPGCASFDMFDSYAARGEAFASAVRRRKEHP